MVVQLIFKQQHLIKEHDVFPSLKLLHVNTLGSLRYLHTKTSHHFLTNL